MIIAKNQLLLSTLVCFMLVFSINRSDAQHFDFGYEYGFSSYFGDLSSFSDFPRTNKTSVSKGYYLGYGNRLGTIYLNYTVAEIHAADSNSLNQDVIDRNLSFRSPIMELGLTAEFNIMSLLSDHYGYTKWQLLAISGVNVFQFNPYTVYQDQKVSLQPLGTEGQGTSLYPDREKYSLTQISIPLGLAVKYELNNKLWLGVGTKIRMTFTDYLDDVSTSYVDPESLIAENGVLAAQLAFRGDELGSSNAVTIGDARGDATTNDWYMTTYVTIGLRFKEDKIYRKRRARSKKNSSNSCPTF